jgi:NitT/TauT family transport system substrate-binding protein
MAWRNGLRLLAIAYLCVLATSSIAQAASSVSLAWTPSADTPQIAEALDKQLWKLSGLDVTTVPFATGRESLEALIGGQVDFAAVAELPAVIGAMRQQKFAVLAVLSSYRGNRIIAKSDADLKSVSDLAGRKVATTLGTNSQFALDWDIQQAGVKVEVVNVAPPDIIPALVRGDVDAAVMFPAFFNQAKHALGAQYREIMMPDYVTRMVLIGTADVIAKRPDDVKKMLAGLLKADALVEGDPAAAQQTIVRVVGKAANLDTIRSGWSDYVYKISLDDGLLTLMTREGQWIRTRGLVKNVEPTEQLFRSYIESKPLGSLDADRVRLH